MIEICVLVNTQMNRNLSLVADLLKLISVKSVSRLDFRPCDHHARNRPRSVLASRAGNLARNWFTWNAGGLFWLCFFLQDGANEEGSLTGGTATMCDVPNYLRFNFPVVLKGGHR